ncbi:diaminopimelate decarboxylase [Catellatospora sp. TT07R-123]|uniref:type III PLP-dependent enzyme n=1 Tax=Catellatospora sp. TT07R-123 TaxID=2733863 RepID=UPI001B13F726|nr:type III PLP-dependent enzyme [Catellatospora sp. TT07R-123]GHJ48858.1 diaminopimelate decarboxylase [Catellatospora sp. TT07R-123]
MGALPDNDEVTPALCAELADRFGTPLYVYDGGTLVRSLAELTGALHPAMEVFYSLKANPNISVLSLLAAHGARAEVSSLVELRTALAAGVDPADIIFLGPGKTAYELAACLDAGVHAVVAESFEELAELDELAARAGRPVRVLVRVNPAETAPGSRLAMGGKPRQFGIDEDQVLAAGDLPGRHPHLLFAGVHGYLGTRILDHTTAVANTAQVLDLAERVAAATGIGLDTVDVGGGLGVAYFDKETDLDLAALREGIHAVVEPFHRRHPGTRLLWEAGRFLAARAGIYLTRVRYVKRSHGQRFAVTDGGTHHHMAAVGIGSFVKRNFPVRALSRPDAPATGLWQLTGPLCTPNDLIAKDVALPDLAPGDLVGILRSGAYGPSASPVLFLSHGHPAEVLVHDGTAYLVRSRDEPADLLRQQHLHDFSATGSTPADSLQRSTR